MTLVERCDEIVRLIEETLSGSGGELAGAAAETAEPEAEDLRSWNTIIP